MAAISVTASSVVASTDNNDLDRGIAGEAITAGQALCRNSTTGVIELFDGNGASAYMKICVGIAAHAASTGQPIIFQRQGNMTFNAVLGAGVPYFGGSTAGGIHPAGDLGSGITTVLIGVGTSTTVLKINIFNSGAAQ